MTGPVSRLFAIGDSATRSFTRWHAANGPSLGGQIGSSYTDRMSRLILELLRLSPLLAVAACGYTPPNAADTGRPGYQADLAACQSSGDTEAHRIVMSKGGLFLTYPISIFVEEHRQIRKCMDGKGYVASLVGLRPGDAVISSFPPSSPHGFSRAGPSRLMRS
jgi:hypothetical protein